MNIENKLQENVKKFQDLGWNVCPIECYKFTLQSDCLKMVSELTGLREGVVVYNTRTGMRVKIKNATYLAAHRLRGNGLTVNAICELVALNEQDEYIAVFPEDAKKFEPANIAQELIKYRLVHNYGAFRNIENQKDFALEVKDLPLACVMFKARSLKIEVIDAFNQFPVSKRAEWIKEQLA